MNQNIKNITKEMAQEIIQEIVQEVASELTKITPHKRKPLDIDDLLIEINTTIKSARLIGSYLTTIKGCADGIENTLKTMSKKEELNQEEFNQEEQGTLLPSAQAIQEDVDLSMEALNILKSAMLNILYITTAEELEPEEE